MNHIVADAWRKFRGITSETVASFRRNNDLSAASSLAFSASLALIPSLFLLTFILGAVIGSSGRALAKTQELLTQFIPAYSQDILREVGSLGTHKRVIGILNAAVLFWGMTLFVADMRRSLGRIFRKKPTRPFLLEKLFDALIGVVFLLGLSAITVAGLLLTLAERSLHVHITLASYERIAPFLFVVTALFIFYVVFSGRARTLHLFAGALSATCLWFAMRPAFHLFLLYNPGYGFAFGSFKSLFVVIIWLYFSLAVFLVGAEIAASLGRGEAFYIKGLIEGKRHAPEQIMARYVVLHTKGSFIFREGDQGNEMFCVLRGKISIRKGDQEIGVITEGRCFGGTSFLLASPRVATAVAIEDVELVCIRNENIGSLMNEYPEFVVELLHEMAQRLRVSDRAVE